MRIREGLPELLGLWAGPPFQPVPSENLFRRRPALHAEGPRTNRFDRRSARCSLRISAYVSTLITAPSQVALSDDLGF
jgi:hypothetical protein